MKEYYKNNFKIIKNINKARSLILCLDCGCEFERDNNRIYKAGCPYCKGTFTKTGFNDINTTNPELVKYFVNKEITLHYRITSHKKVKMKCPNCGSERVQKRNLGTKVVAGVGGVAGAVTGAIGAGEGAAAGAAIGTALLPGVGTVVGGIMGAIAGAAAGATAGAIAGKALDEYVLDSYVCNACEHTFDAE